MPMRKSISRNKKKQQGSRLRFDSASKPDKDNEDKDVGKHVVRSHFPETWLFQLKPVDRHGKADVSLKAPDTLTSWTGEAVCMSSKAGIGLAQPASILVKKVTVIMR